MSLWFLGIRCSYGNPLGISSLQDGEVNLHEKRCLSSSDYTKWTHRVKPETGDVVFSYETRLGQAAIIPPGLECCLGRRMGLVRVNRRKLNPRFFLFQNISPDFQIFLKIVLFGYKKVINQQEILIKNHLTLLRHSLNR